MKENYIELGTVSKFTCAVSDPLIFIWIEIMGAILLLVLANTNEIGCIGFMAKFGFACYE